MTIRAVFLAAVLIVLVVILTGCDTLTAIPERGAEGSDAALDAAVWTVCKASTVGAVNRRYNTPEKATTYREFCGLVEEIHNP